MDYESISQNGHQLSRPLHQDNANLTTLQVREKSESETTMKSMEEKIDVNKQSIAREKPEKGEKSAGSIALIRRHAGLKSIASRPMVGFERELDGGVIN